jgi:hypothetical protein
MKAFTKKDFPVSQIRRFLEPGPIVLVSSAWKGETNIMTMGWHTVMEFEPSLVGCMISSGNHSFGMIKASKECVINIPTFDLAKQVVGIGNCSGAEVAKFEMPNPWGVFNVHGNVWDWTDDCWNESNAGNPGDGTARTTGDCRWRVVRGGAWNYSPTYLRAAFRYWNVPHNRSGVQSLRVARTL